MTEPDSYTPDRGGGPEQKRSIRQGLMARLRGYLLAGILVTAPLSITFYVTRAFLLFIDAQVTPLIPVHYNPGTYLPFSMPGLGLIIALAFFILVGWFAKNFLGRLIISLSEGIVHRVPVVRTIYRMVKQIMESVAANKSQSFRDVVMFEYPRKGIWVMGFVTGVPGKNIQNALGGDVVSVLMSTALNATSGVLLFIPRKDLIYLDMDVDAALRTIVSGGILVPPERASRRSRNGGT